MIPHRSLAAAIIYDLHRRERIETGRVMIQKDMTIEDIQNLISGDENRVLELKKTTGELKDAMRSACAFLNTDGGWVIFGIAPTSLKIVGQQITDNTRKEIGQEIAKLYPALDLKPIYVPVPGKTDFYVIALHLNAWPRGTTPFTYDSRPYYRLESITKIMPREMFEARIRESQPHLYAWERQQANGINIEDLDDNLITGVVRSGVKGGRLSSSALSETTENILSKFQLLNEGKLNNAAVALFAKETGWYTQLELRMARFKGNGKNEFGDNQSLKGNFFKLFDAGMAFFFKHLNLSGKITGTRREEELEIPYVALREALTNALCHRTYDELGPSVGIAIYDDRVEIENPGSFPPHITAETIKQPHDSHPRNPLIANVLYLSTYLEKWGSGVSRIIEACQQQGVPEPTYEDRGSFIHIVFKRKPFILSDDTWNNAQENEYSGQEILKVDKKGGQEILKVDKKGGQEILKVDRKDGLRTREAILELIVANNNITSTQIVERLGINRSAVTKHLKKLQDEDIIKREGPKKGGQWVILKK